jgi:hypothetical protein
MKASEKGFTYEINPEDPMQLLNENPGDVIHQ